MSSDVLASLKWPANGWLWQLRMACKWSLSWSGMYRCPWNLSCPSAHSQPKGRSEVPNLLHRSWARGSDLATWVMSVVSGITRVEQHQNPSYECIKQGPAKWALATLEINMCNEG